VTFAVIKLALIAALASTEIAWWEGPWADRGVACNASSADRPMKLSSTMLDLGEAECAPSRSKLSAKSVCG
jgi:hypothetical protein